MKRLKIILVSLIVGLAIGFALGTNYGREKPLLSNPFQHESLDQKLKRLGGETLEKGGKAIEKTGQSLQKKLGN
jgi:hypothetical protein